MPNIRFPTKGSMQFWPRKKAKKPYARVRAWTNSALGFAGYKVGMTHVIIQKANRVNKRTFDVSLPVTVVECPPLKVFSARFYKLSEDGKKVVDEVIMQNPDKEMRKKIPLPKKNEKKIGDVADYEEIRILVHTQPKLAGFGKKKPELFEMAVPGSKDEQLAWVKENLGKEIPVENVVKEGALLDTHTITKGKGFQGPVKRFGVKIRAAKSEKTKRGPGSLGGWKAQGHVMYRVPHAGQMGYHQRKERNKWVLKVSDDPKQINAKGGFVNYGLVKSSYILLKGSITGPRKRLIIFSEAERPKKNVPNQAPDLKFVCLDSKQG